MYPIVPIVGQAQDDIVPIVGQAQDDIVNEKF